MAIKPKLNRNNSQTVRRALMILDYIGEHGAGHGCSLMELSRGVSLNKSTVLRLLEPLMESRLVEKNQQKAWYQLGVRTAFLGSLYLDSLDIRTVAAPMLRQLVNASGETVHLVFYRHPDIVYIDKLDSPNTVRMASRIGMSMPAYCTAAGKAFLAYPPDSTLESVVGAGLAPRTENTLISESALRADLKLVQARGYAIDNIENEVDIRCVGAPIFDHDMQPVAGISVSGPAHRLTLDKAQEIGSLVREATAQASASLDGAVPDEEKQRMPKAHISNRNQIQ